MPTHVIEVTGIVVYDGKIVATVSCDPGYWLVDTYAAQRIEELLAGIGRQACISSGHKLFSEELLGTQAPHLLEHVALELEACEAGLCAGSGMTTRADGGMTPQGAALFTGFTRLVPRASDGQQHDGLGRRWAEVSISFEDDLVGIGAIKWACGIVDYAFGLGVHPPSAGRISQELHALRMER